MIGGQDGEAGRNTTNCSTKQDRGRDRDNNNGKQTCEDYRYIQLDTTEELDIRIDRKKHIYKVL